MVQNADAAKSSTFSPAPTPGVLPDSNKRPRADGRDEEGTTTRDEVQDSLDSHLQKQNELVVGLLSESNKNNAKLLSDFAHRTEQRLQRQDERLDGVEGRCTTIETKQDQVQAELDSIKKEQLELRESLRLANKAAITREDLQSQDFERPPDLTIIKIKAPKFATKIAVENAVTPWINGIRGAKDLWTVSGNTTGKKFTIRFQQNPVTAAGLVKDCLAGLKDSNGIWKEIMCDLPNSEKARLHISADESPRVELQRRMGAAMRKAIAELYPHFPEVHYRHAEAAVYSDRDGIASMQPKDKNVVAASFHWNHPGVEKLKINKEALINKTLVFLAGVPIEWRP